jgi:site-specific recombinase XerD
MIYVRRESRAGKKIFSIGVEFEMAREKNVFDRAEMAEPMGWEYVLDEYLDFLRGCGRSDKTTGTYRDQVSRFYRERSPEWDGEREEFLAWNGEPQIHTNHRLDACDRFWRWAIGAGHRKTNPADGAFRRLTNKTPVANVNLADIGKVVKVFRERHKLRPTWEKLRNYAYVTFAIATGVRPGEGLKLRRADFNIAERFVVVRGEFVKTRQSRVIYLPRDNRLLALLRRMIRAQTRAGLPSSSPLFSGGGGAELRERSWFHIVQRAAHEAGVKIKPYDFRHAFITHSLADGANPYDLRDQVGHANMEMMKRYYHSSAEARRSTADLSPLRKLAQN